MIWITVKQKRELKTFNVLKYGDSSDVYCCKECQEKHLKELSEAEFLTKGNLKNREYALIIHDVDVTKRLREKEVHVISGNVTEQRARCLFEKLNSVTPYKGRKSLTSEEVKFFLLNDLPANIKASASSVEVTAWYVMNKCEKLFPNLVLIQMYKGKSREVLLIN